MEMLYGNMAKIVLPREETFNGTNDSNNITIEFARELERLNNPCKLIVEKNEDEDEFVIKAYVESLKRKK